MISQRQERVPAGLLALSRRIAGGLWPGRRPLTRLVDVHPGRLAGGRWIGLETVPTDGIRGTATLSASRGQDFRPLDGRKPADWHARWSRLESAADQLAILPPVQLVRAGGDYWVVDGHNRVAIARERGQRWIDAEVTEVDLTSQAAAA